MAVWIQIIGLRKSQSIKNERAKISDILNRIKFDVAFIEKKAGAKLENTDWNLTTYKGIEHFELSIFDQSLKIYFDNPDYIEFSGSFELFSSWFWFTDKAQSEITDGIRAMFRNFALAYGISELIYFSEWFFELGEIRTNEETFDDLIEWIQQNPNRRRKTFFGLEANEYFIEEIS